jgi:enoyl-CoA hydratase/carnithine racemase
MISSGIWGIMAFEYLNLSVANKVGWVEYNRLPFNGFNWEMLGQEDVRVVVLSSTLDNYFSAATDLTIFDGIRPKKMREWVKICHGHLMQNAHNPLLAAIHGMAVGGGLELTSHCDFCFAAEDAKIGQLEIAINFIPPVGTTQTLACLIGRPKAIKFLYDSKILSAIKALDIGLVDKLHPAEELRPYVQSYAESLASNPTKVLAAIRRCITLGGGMPFEKSLDYEIEQAAALTDTPDFIEGVKTFLEKN